MSASGLAIGGCLAPLTAAISRLRSARMFHPDGLVFSARVQSLGDEQALWQLGERLAGSALLRFSSALWREGREWPDVLGVGIRFKHGSMAASAEREASDQDLLLATIRFPWTMPFAPLATNFHSFLWNHYHAVSPFRVEGMSGSVKFRLRSPRVGNGGPSSRDDHLRRAVAEGQASFQLELRHLETPALQRQWLPVAQLTLEHAVELDQAALRLSPFNAGRGIHPTGFVHSIRVGAYAASQAARPAQQA